MAPRPYIVTRYVPGPALDEVVEERGPLAPADLLRLARGIAEAIRAIHACGVVHRDIKPGNVLIEDGDPVLIDFGIAHLQDDVRHTVGGLVMGTPGYLSPELVEGAAITDATDWWGWAATITYAASGRPPFGRARMDAVLTRVRAGDVDLDGVDPRLVPLLRASLSPDPRLRPHADEVIAALELYAAGRAATVPTPSGGLWDDGRVGRGPGRHPGRPGRQHGGHAARFRQPVTPPVALPTAHRGADTPARWAPPPTGPRAPTPDLTAYDHEDVEDGPADGYWPEEEWDEEEPAPREGDPRIGLPMRTGLLAAVSAAWIGALMAWPGIALVALVALSALARATDRSVTALVLRRYDFGRRRSDVPFAVVSSPVAPRRRHHRDRGRAAAARRRGAGRRVRHRPAPRRHAGHRARPRRTDHPRRRRRPRPAHAVVGAGRRLAAAWVALDGAAPRARRPGVADRRTGCSSSWASSLRSWRCDTARASRGNPSPAVRSGRDGRSAATLTRFGGACGRPQRPLCGPCAGSASALQRLRKKITEVSRLGLCDVDNVTYRQCSAEPGLWPERELHHLVPGSLRRVRLHTNAPTTSHGHPSIRSLSAPSLASQGCSPHPWAGRGRGTQCGQ